VTRSTILVHSGICDTRMWDGFELPGATRHEMRGFGDTPLPAIGEYSHAADLEAAIGERPVALVGSSFGGLVSLAVAARRPEHVSELVLLDAPLADHDWSAEMDDYEQEEEGLIEQGDLRGAALLNAGFWPGPDASEQVRARIVEMCERALGLQAESEAEETDPYDIDLAAVRARTLVAVGEHDKADFRRIALRLAAEIPDAAHTVIPGAGHLPALERPAETALLVRDFLAG
jgi:3-oxoadipate enol-lactonase